MANFPIQWRRVGFLIGIGILVLVIVDLNARLDGLRKLDDEMVVVATQATQAMQTQIALQTQVAYANSDQAVVDYARSEAHLVQDGDIPVAPVGDGKPTPTPPATPTLASTPVNNWQIWWKLFFGE